MAYETKFSLQRRMMAIGDYTTVTTTAVTLRPVGIINSAEIEFPRTVSDFKATDVSGDSCREYIANSSQVAEVGMLKIEMMSGEAKNLAVALGSAVTAVTAATAQTICSTVAVGDVVSIPDIPNTSGVVVTDSAGSPQTLVEGTQWKYTAKKAGQIEILSITSTASTNAVTQPLKINYTKRAASTIKPMSALTGSYYIVLDGANERDSCNPAKDVFYKARITESQALRLHEPAETIDPQPVSVTFTIDRDPGRSYEFGLLSRTA